MTSETKGRGPRLGRWILRGLAISFVFVVLVLVPLGGSSKNSSIELPLYLPKYPHQAQGYSLAQSGLREPGARAWLDAAERAVGAPQDVSLPFEASGDFGSEATQALGYRFTARSGERIYIDVESDAAAGEVFVDLFVVEAGTAVHLKSTPPTSQAGGADRRRVTRRIEVPMLAPADYVLRVQPAPGWAGAYKVSVRGAPFLLFPVEGASARAIQSGFGAERDGGARAHRGVDIFAARGTPAVAAMDAWVARVETTQRGGNVVWLQPLFGNVRLYYAHLDTQLVRPGDLVLAGDPVGTVGNTGNARTTPPHLHFGVYIRERGRRGGARDPHPFLD